LETEEAWQKWASADNAITGEGEPPLREMHPMLRRRAGFLGKMALEAAYRCLGKSADVPTVFCSRHGDSSRCVGLLSELARSQTLSPTSFSLAVHNAIGGLFSIARNDHAANTALAGGQSSVEHAVIEACGLLAEGVGAVLLVVYDCPLPAVFSKFADCHEQPFAWAWLMQPTGGETVSLAWSGAQQMPRGTPLLPAGLEILRFYLRRERVLVRISDGRQWRWTRHV
jgi:hypothetical protein